MAVRTFRRCTPSDTAWFTFARVRSNALTLPIETCGSNASTQVGLVSSRFCATGAQVSPKLKVSNASSPLPPEAPRRMPLNSGEPAAAGSMMLSRIVVELSSFTQFGIGSGAKRQRVARLRVGEIAQHCDRRLRRRQPFELALDLRALLGVVVANAKAEV